MAKRLVISFVGRTCLVTKGDDAWVLFLNAEHNKELGLRRHQALMSVPLSMIASEEAPQRAVLTSAARVQPLNRGQVVDSLGIWDIGHYDISIGGILEAGRGDRQIEDLADLNALAGPSDLFEGGVIGDDLARFPIVMSRMRLPRSTNLIAVTEDLTVKTFLPGGYRQVIASYLRVSATFANDLRAPTLTLRALKSDIVQKYEFNATDYEDVEVMMTNLCNCVKRVGKVVDGHIVDDEEFALYYDLMRTPPAIRDRPLPHVPRVTRGVHIPDCFYAARLAF